MGKNAKQACKRDCERDVQAAMLQAASSMGIGRQAKRDCTQSGDRVILLTSLEVDTHLSVTFISDMQHMPKLCCNVCLLQCNSYGLLQLLVLCFTLVFEGLWY